MKRLFILLWLMPVLGFCQDGEQYLRSSASMLANNRSIQKRFYYAETREQKRLDTLSASGENYRYRALNYLWHQQYEQAEIWLEKTTTLYPREHGFVGEQYLHLRDYPRALAHFDAYDALTPNFDDIVGYNPVSYMRGLVHRATGNHQKAIEQFSVGIDSLTKKHGTEWVNYKHFVSRAVSYIATQQAEKALIDLEKAAKNFNRSALIHYHRGRALLQLGQTAEARTAFQDASFFFKALRAERSADYQEDDYNPVYEPEIDEALANLKNQRP
ncbi:tetratricopeptide repeat protein [Spirosoma sp. BT702]|uniref:Tetratricopeptide repeat protein n=1 Tax=Spirosoma profusum TaxID=2771354 RepID=A0A926XT98_9BACT|nr:tetratricopeptide repeat protein [Spirosoma profusum]MBD2699607.1 tetratricopeptide repeat protein [Spirosoma profusum]